MDARSQSGRSDLEAILQEGRNLLGLQILHAAFAAGVGILGVVVVFLHLSGALRSDRPPAGGDNMIPLLTAVHAFVLAAAWSFALLVLPRVARSHESVRTSPGADGQDPVGSWFDRLRTGAILRLAALEAPALLGLVVCLLGSIRGALDQDPLYWLNALSAVVFIVYVVLRFPTRERILQQWKERSVGQR